MLFITRHLIIRRLLNLVTVEFAEWLIATLDFILGIKEKISSQKAGNPMQLYSTLEVYGIIKDKRVFLQHGCNKGRFKWLYYDVTKMDRFICGAYPEYRFVEKHMAIHMVMFVIQDYAGLMVARKSRNRKRK